MLLFRKKAGLYLLATLRSLGVVAVVSTWRHRPLKVEIRWFFGKAVVCLLALTKLDNIGDLCTSYVIGIKFHVTYSCVKVV